MVKFSVQFCKLRMKYYKIVAYEIAMIQYKIVNS